MFMDLREKYWWRAMKRDIAEFVAKCDVCRRVKAEHQRPAGLLQHQRGGDGGTQGPEVALESLASSGAGLGLFSAAGAVLGAGLGLLCGADGDLGAGLGLLCAAGGDLRAGL